MSNHVKGGVALMIEPSTSNSHEIDLGRLLSLYGDDLLRISYLFLRDYHSAEDAVQDTFEKAIRYFPQFRGECTEGTWLTRIAINVCKNQLRKKRHLQHTGDADFCAFLATEPLCATEPNASLSLAISKLSPKLKEAVLLFYFQEMPLKEIAVTLHIPVATVSTRLIRAREVLKNTAKEWFYDE